MSAPNVPGPSNLPPDPSRDIPPSNIPPSGGTPPPYMPPPPARPTGGGGGLFSARNIIIGLIALALLCACACGAAFLAFGQGANILGQTLQTSAPGLVDTAQVTAVAQAFMTELKSGNWSGAYAMCTPDLQKELGSAQALGSKITSGKAQPVEWTFSKYSAITSQSSDAQIDGTAKFTGNTSGTLRLVLDRVSGSQWKISGFNLTPK